MIVLKNIWKKYGNVNVLKDCNLEIKPGNIYLLKGKSGSGKSTLLNILGMLDSNYDGEIFINNIDYKTMSKKNIEKYKKHISYVMQKNLFYKNLSLKENLLIIKNNIKQISQLSEEFNVIKLLDKKPTELSGGELQRFAIIRSLLNESSIIILDEPTSSLDHKNSIIFANYLKKINKKNKIIIIATHKDVFDDISNVIFNIEYGKINKIKDFSKPYDEIEFNENIKKRRKLSSLILRNRFKEGIFSRILLITLMLLVFISASFYINFRKEYIKKEVKDFSYNVIDIDIKAEKNVKEKIENYYSIKKSYNNYFYESGFEKVYTLLDYEDSTFKQDGAIFLGAFPNKKNEILVNKEYALSIAGPSQDYNNALNQKVIIKDKIFFVSGIVCADNVDAISIYKNTKFYKSIYDGGKITPAIFMLYDSIMELGNIKDDYIIISLDENKVDKIYENNELNQSLFYMSTNYALYQNKIDQTLAETISPTKTSIIVAIILLILSFFFIINEVSLNLYYKRKEIGHLQLLHFSKDEIEIIFILQYMLSFLINVMLSLVIYFAVIIYIFKIYKFNLILSFSYIITFIVSFLLYGYFIIVSSLKKYIKIDIINLLKS